MILKSLRYMVGLGIVGGLAVVLTPAANAQTVQTTSTTTQTQAQRGIEVTGGKIAGEAAFFIPGMSAAGNVTLFDVGGIQTLEIISPNGRTTTAQFEATAASFSDADRSGTPNMNDTGVLRGGLTGVAFTPQGIIVPYTNVDTVLNFQLNSFNQSSSNLVGTLISPKVGVNNNAAPIFLPNVTATLSSQSQAEFQATEGNLQIGNFDAALNNGLIDLPSNYILGNSSSAIISQPSLIRKLKFEFEGQNLAGGSYTFAPTSNSLNFAGTANQKFKIESEGSGGQNFKIDGTLGYVDITVNGLTGTGNKSKPAFRQFQD